MFPVEEDRRARSAKMGPESGADNATRSGGMQAVEDAENRHLRARRLTRWAGRVTLLPMSAEKDNGRAKKTAEERSARLAAALRENLHRRKAQERSRGGKRRSEDGGGTEGSEGRG